MGGIESRQPYKQVPVTIAEAAAAAALAEKSDNAATNLPLSPLYEMAVNEARTRLHKLASEFQDDQQVEDRRSLDKILRALETDCLSPYSGVLLSDRSKPKEKCRYETSGLTRMLSELNIEHSFLHAYEVWPGDGGYYLEKHFRFRLKPEWMEAREQ